MNIVATEVNTVKEASNDCTQSTSGFLHDRHWRLAKDVRAQVVSGDRDNRWKGSVARFNSAFDGLLYRLTVLRRNPTRLDPTGNFLRVAADLASKGGLGRKSSYGALDCVHGRQVNTVFSL